MLAFGGILFFLILIVLLGVGIWFLIGFLRGTQEAVGDPPEPDRGDRDTSEDPSLLERDLSFADRPKVEPDEVGPEESRPEESARR